MTEELQIDATIAGDLLAFFQAHPDPLLTPEQSVQALASIAIREYAAYGSWQPPLELSDD